MGAKLTLIQKTPVGVCVVSSTDIGVFVYLCKIHIYTHAPTGHLGKILLALIVLAL